MSTKFSTAVLNTLTKTVEVEFKVPLLGFGEIKFPVSEYAKDWWKTEKAHEDLLNAIDIAEQRFIAQHPENKAAQILHDFSLRNEEDFRNVIAELLNHLDENKITWLMADKLGKGFERIINNKEIYEALNDYIPILQDELAKLREFREVISYLLQKQIASTTSLTYETAKEIKGMLKQEARGFRGSKLSIEKTVFISYRRTNFPWAYCIYQDLTHHGFDVFLDYQSVDSGNFEKIILDNIRARAHFIIILSPSALEGCNQPEDWLRREIETALDERRNIIPVLLEGFDFESLTVKKALTGKLGYLRSYSGLHLISEYVEAGFEKLRNRFLNLALEDVHLYVLGKDAQQITESKKAAVSEVTPVEKEQLTAQEWFERGYKSLDKDEKIQCYTEAIRLDPSLAEAYYQRGSNRQDREDLDGAIADYTEAIRIKTDYAEAYNNRGNARLRKEDFIGAIADYTLSIENNNPEPHLLFSNRAYVRRLVHDVHGAIEDYTEVINLKPDSALAYTNRGNLYRITGRLEDAIRDYEEVIRLNPQNITARSSLMTVLRNLGKHEIAKEQEEIVRELVKTEKEYNQACFEALCGNVEMAVLLLQIAIEKKQVRKQLIQLDPDLENIRDDPRFKQLVSG